jgi:hypothetical protein
LLLQIANKIQNGALNCEEKLTLAKNTLQAVSLYFVLLLMLHVFYFSPSALRSKLIVEEFSCVTSFFLEVQWAF